MANSVLMTTAAGRRAAYDAIMAGIKIKIGSVVFGDTVISDPTTIDSMTQVPGNQVIVLSGADFDSAVFVSGKFMGDGLPGSDGFQISINLSNEWPTASQQPDPSISTVNIGSVGLVLDNNVLFAVGTISQIVNGAEVPITKTRVTNEGAGDSKKFFGVVNLVQGGNAVETNVVQSPITALYRVSNDRPQDPNTNPGGIPPTLQSPLNSLFVENFCNTGMSAFAVRDETSPRNWRFSTMEGRIQQIDQSQFPLYAASVGLYISYDPSTGTYLPTNGTNAATNNFNPIGLYVGDGGYNNVGYVVVSGPVPNYAGSNTISPEPYLANTRYTIGVSGSLIPATGQDSFVVGLSDVNGNLRINLERPTATTVQVNSSISDCPIPSRMASRFALIDSARTISGNWTFTGSQTFSQVIQGTALRAQWGDLAEYYESDEDYAPGTLVKFGGSKEITTAGIDDVEVNFVVSTKPGLELNAPKKEENSPDERIMLPCALVGRVPVRVCGSVKKFDKLYLSHEFSGTATNVVSNTHELIGVALEDSVDGYVLASVKLNLGA